MAREPFPDANGSGGELCELRLLKSSYRTLRFCDQSALYHGYASPLLPLQRLRQT